MKKLPLILSSISLVGVLVLFGLYFNDKKVSETNEELDVAVDSLAAHQLSFPVAYVEMDSILKNYKFVQKMQKDLESQYKSAEARFQSKLKKHQKKLQEFQNDAALVTKMQQNGSLTEAELAQQQQTFTLRQQQLAKDEQNIALLQQQLQQQIGENQAKLNNEMSVNIQNFLKKYSNELNYTYVMVKGPGSSVWFGADSLDISDKLINVLNAEFDEKQLKEASAKE